MSKIRKVKLVCEKCGKEFESEHFDSVNVTLDPDLKERALSGEVFTKRCPHCEHEHFGFGNLLYHDMERGFMIQCGSGPELFLSSIDQEHGLAAVQNQFGVKLNIKMLGATSLCDLRTKVIALENGLDFRAASIVCFQVAEAKREEHEKSLPKEEGPLGAVCFLKEYWLEKNSEELAIRIILESWTKGKTEASEIAAPFPIKQYERILREEIGLLDDMAPFYFDDSVVKRFLNFDRNALDWYRNTKSRIAIGRDIRGNRHFLEIMSFKFQDFDEGDVVIARKGHQNSGRLSGYLIEKILDIPEIKIPIVYKDRAIVLWKHEPVPMETSEDSDAEIDNEELIEAMEKAKSKDGKNYDVLLSQADGIVCTVAQLKEGVTEEEFQKAMESGRIPPEWVDLDFLTLTSKKDQKEALCVFLSQEAAKRAEKTSNGKQIYPMDQIINCVLRNPDRYCGIMFYTKDDGSRELMSISELLYYKHGRIMLDAKRMVNLLEKLTPAEKEYITEEYLQVIQMVYFEEKKPDEIAQTLGISTKEVGNRLSWGYGMLVDVVQANY